MSVIDNFKQSEEAMDIARGAAMIAIGAAIATTVVAVRMNAMSKQIDQLQKAAELNAAVTLNLVSRVAPLSMPRLDNQ